MPQVLLKVHLSLISETSIIFADSAEQRCIEAGLEFIEDPICEDLLTLLEYFILSLWSPNHTDAHCGTNHETVANVITLFSPVL
jgi:hypothetical protein